MAMLNFNSAGIDTTPRFDVLPAGDYPVIITDSELKQTKNGAGQYLSLTLEIQGGEFAGRKLFDRLNLRNPSKTTQEIAERQLAQICNAVNEIHVADSVVLHHKPLIAITVVKPAKDQYAAGNEIKGYKPMPGIDQSSAPAFARPTAAAAPVPAATPAAYAAKAAPWARA